MNTKEAYDKFKAGVRIGVIVTNAVDRVSSTHEIDADAWERRLAKTPHNTNYVIIPEGRGAVENHGSTAYRLYENETAYGVYDYCGEFTHTAFGSMTLKVMEYKIIKFTPKGFWISLGGERTKFVLRDARKKYASLTMQDALDCFRARKKAHVRILSGKLHSAERALALAETYDINIPRRGSYEYQT